MKLGNIVNDRDPVQCFAQYYARAEQVTPAYAKQLLTLLNHPEQLAYGFYSNDDPKLTRHIANICDPRSPYAKEMNKIFGAAQMANWRETYRQLARKGVNFERFMNPFYTFEQFQQRDERAYHDPYDFKLNPQLLTALQLDSCPATTGEGQALWTYTKLCSVMKYDEGYMYHDYRDDLNDDFITSFELLEKITPETPVTCYNFSRIAVKLLNQIPGINATVIATGRCLGHFRFGFYSNKFSVDVESLRATGGYNDLVRAKLGLVPVGMQAIYGEKVFDETLDAVVKPWLASQPKPMAQYIAALNQVPAPSEPTPIDLPVLLTTLKKHGIVGSEAVQVLLKMNREFAQKPYDMARAATLNVKGVTPYLLVRQDNQIMAVNLEQMTLEPCNAQHLRRNLQNGTVVYADNIHTLGGLEK